MHYAVMATKQHYFLQLPRVDWCKLSIEITLLVGSVVVTCRSAGRPASTVIAAYSVSLYDEVDVQNIELTSCISGTKRNY